MGAALIAKPGLNRHFSVITFGLAQVAMDIEPGVGMLTDADVLHGPTHTVLGALVIASLVMLIAPSICSYLLKRWNKEVTYHKQPWLVQSAVVSKAAVITGALFGTLSHVALDSLIHHDIRPLLPFSGANPLLGLVTHDAVYELCAIAGLLGVVAWLAMAWLGRPAQVDDVKVSPEPTVKKAHQGFWALWVRDLRLTWVWVCLTSIGPSLLFGAAILSIFALVLGILVGVPSAAVSQLRASASASRNYRRLAIMVLVPFVTSVEVPGRRPP